RRGGSVARVTTRAPARAGRGDRRRPPGALLRVAVVLRARGRDRAVRARLRGPPVGGAGPARLHRPRPRVVAEAPGLRARARAARGVVEPRRLLAERPDP